MEEGTMEEKRAEQKEALEVFCEYNGRFVKSVRTIIPELEGDRKDDTDEFLQGIVKGINWEIGILNGTLDFINEKEERVKKEEVNGTILKLSKAIEGKDDREIAECLKEALPMFEALGQAAKDAIA